MKKLLFIVMTLTLFTLKQSKCQITFEHSYSAQANLVNNSSFEDTIGCPFSLDLTYFSTGWTAYRGTPDYFNTCATSSSLVSIPFNCWGYQNAASGNAYMGLKTFIISDYREFIGSHLNFPMIIGQKYFVSMSVCCAYDTSNLGQRPGCASNKLGFLFSTIDFSSSNPAPINNFAHIYTDSIISDTVHWSIIKGSFIADSSYEYIIIGNFFDDLHTDTLQLIHDASQTYYFIDNICVTTDSIGCNIVESLNELDNPRFALYPNPANNKINIINTSNLNSDIIIYNSIGDLVFSKNNVLQSEIYTIDVGLYPDGFYYIILKNLQFVELKRIAIIHK